MTPLSAPLIFGPNDYRKINWPNGEGSLEAVARHPRSGGSFLWIAGLQTIARDCRVPSFGGCDHCILLLDGSGLALSQDGEKACLVRPGNPVFSLDGDTPVDCSPHNGVTRAFVMTLDRSSVMGTLTLLANGANSTFSGHVILAYAASGPCRILPQNQQALVLPAGHTAIIHGNLAIIEADSRDRAIFATLLARQGRIIWQSVPTEDSSHAKMHTSKRE